MACSLTGIFNFGEVNEVFKHFHTAQCALLIAYMDTSRFASNPC